MTPKKPMFALYTLLLGLFLCLFSASVIGFNSENYTEYYKIKITNPYTDDLNDYPINVGLSTYGFNCSNYALLEENNTQIPFYVDIPGCNNSSSQFWFKINITSGNYKTYYLYATNLTPLSNMEINKSEIVGAKSFNYDYLKYHIDFNSPGFNDTSTGYNESLTFSTYNDAVKSSDCFADNCLELTSSNGYYQSLETPYVFYNNYEDITIGLRINMNESVFYEYKQFFENDDAVEGSTQFGFNGAGGIQFKTYPGAPYDYEGILNGKGLNASFSNKWVSIIVKKARGLGENELNYTLYINGEWWDNNTFYRNFGGPFGSYYWNFGFHIEGLAAEGKYDDFFLYTAALTDKQLRHLGGYYNPEIEITGVCFPSWECSDFNSCDINNVSVCTETRDLNNCGVGFVGNLSDYNEACVYVPPKIETGLLEWDITTSWGLWLLLGLMALWVALAWLDIISGNFIFKLFFVVLGVVLMIMTFNIIWVLSACFGLFSLLGLIFL